MSIIEKALIKLKNEDAVLNANMGSNLKGSFDDTIPLTVVATNNEIKDLSNEINDDKLILNIDWKHLSDLGFAAPGSSNSEAIEEYRNIKRPIVNNAFGKGSEGITRANLILVTSSLPGEGKTFTAINLAISIANERDKKVLLIDADVARPSVSKVLGINDSPGLIEYLDGADVSFSDIIVRTSIPGLCIIPAGKLHKYSTELLSSNKMALFVEELSNRYPDRIVIFDSPPLLAATQGEVLARLVGQVILVIEAEQTLQNVVMESVEKLAACDVVLALFRVRSKTQMPII